MKLRKPTIAVLLSFCFVATSVVAMAATTQVAPGLAWNRDSYIQSNGARYCYSELIGYNYGKWVKVKMTYDIKVSGWKSASYPSAFTSITGSLWETGQAFYDFY